MLWGFSPLCLKVPPSRLRRPHFWGNLFYAAFTCFKNSNNKAKHCSVLSQGNRLLFRFILMDFSSVLSPKEGFVVHNLPSFLPFTVFSQGLTILSCTLQHHAGKSHDDIHTMILTSETTNIPSLEKQCWKLRNGKSIHYFQLLGLIWGGQRRGNRTT